MLILLWGSDTFRSRQYLKQMTAEFKAKRDPSGLNAAFFDAKQAEGREILAALLAAPFLGEKRLTAVENLFQSNQMETMDALLELIKNKKIPESATGIFWEGEAKKKGIHPLFDVLAKQKFSREFKNLTGSALRDWISAELTRRNIKAEGRVLLFLTDYPWADLWQLNSELDKFAAYISKQEDKTLTIKDVSLFIAENVDGNVFKFIDALVGRRTKEAVGLLHGLWDRGEEEAQVFGAIIWQFRVLLNVKDYLALNPGLPSDRVAQALKLHPFVVKKAVAILPGFSFEKLKALYQDLLEIDIKTKTGGGDFKTLLELLIAKIA